MKLPEHQQWCKRHHALAMTIKTIKKKQKAKTCPPTMPINIVEESNNQKHIVDNKNHRRE
jgi:hypothetical protein